MVDSAAAVLPKRGAEAIAKIQTPVTLKVQKPSNGANLMPPSTPAQSYVGTDVYVVINVHHRTYTVVVQVGQILVKKWTRSAEPAELSEQLQKYFTGGIIHTVYKAGFSGFVLHRELIAQGIDSIVVHPAAVEVAMHDRVNPISAMRKS